MLAASRHYLSAWKPHRLPDVADLIRKSLSVGDLHLHRAGLAGNRRNIAVPGPDGVVAVAIEAGAHS